MKKYSIYRRIITLTLLSFVVQAILMAGITYTRYRSGMEQADDAFGALMLKNEQHITAQFESVKNIASGVGYAPNVQEYSLKMNANGRVNNYQSIKLIFSLLTNANPSVKAICIANENGVFLEQGGYLTMFYQFMLDYRDDMGRIGDEGFFSHIYHNVHVEKDESPYCIYFLPVTSLLSIGIANDTQFYCLVLFDMAKLLQSDNEDLEMIEFLASNEELLFASRDFPKEDILLNSAATADGSFITKSNGQNYYACSFELDVDTPLRYSVIVPIVALMGDVNNYVRFSIVMIFLTLVITARLLLSMRRSILQPIRQITEDMRHVTDESGIIRPTQAEELNIISVGVNRMLYRLRDMQKQALVQQEKYYLMDLEKTRAEIMSYRSQINPHFLFNTLECMCSMARYYNIEPMEKLTMAMADNYRYVLRAPDFALLGQEIAHVKNYMQIMDIRYPGRFNLNVDAQAAVLNTRVLSMLLQPLVENAVLHGFADYDKEEQRVISIHAEEADQNLRIKVRDNGMGISPERLDELRKAMCSDDEQTERTHIGLRNISRRLHFAYGEEGGRMEIFSEQGRYTSIEIVIPMEK